MIKALRTVGRYMMLMGRTFSRPERMRMFFRQYLNEIEQLGVNSIGIVQTQYRKPLDAPLDSGLRNA